jgi:acetoin utilization deacetylase AcuC-like enzyme
MASPGGSSLFVVDDPLFDEHRARGYHPERPERLLAARHALEALRGRGVSIETLAARDATADEIARVHHGAYVEHLERHEGLFAALDDDTYLGPRSLAAAYRAAGGAVALVDALLDAPASGKVGGRAGAAARTPRPPGRGMGFCLFNNVAIAAEHALARPEIERVLVLDWDVHHGNGTQAAFYGRRDVLFFSVHQYPFYPGTGGLHEQGTGAGEGYTINVPLPAGATDADYRRMLADVVAPRRRALRPGARARLGRLRRTPRATRSAA